MPYISQQNLQYNVINSDTRVQCYHFHQWGHKATVFTRMRWWMATEMGLFSKGLQLAHLNVQSIRGKLDQVKDMIVTSKVDLYGFSETFLNNKLCENELFISGYSYLRRDRNEKSGGGILVHIKETIVFRRIAQFEDGTIESVWLELQLNNSKIICPCEGFKEE